MGRYAAMGAVIKNKVSEAISDGAYVRRDMRSVMMLILSPSGGGSSAFRINWRFYRLRQIVRYVNQYVLLKKRLRAESNSKLHVL